MNKLSATEKLGLVKLATKPLSDAEINKLTAMGILVPTIPVLSSYETMTPYGRGANAVGNTLMNQVGFGLAGGFGGSLLGHAIGSMGSYRGRPIREAVLGTLGGATGLAAGLAIGGRRGIRSAQRNAKKHEEEQDKSSE
jgi:hypothetical protein